jgi:hypothetical protein
MHHGSFSATNQEMVLDTINTRLRKASQRLAQTEVLIITFGTAWVYYLQSTREVVSNCHKMPAKKFVRETFLLIRQPLKEVLPCLIDFHASRLSHA